MSKGVTLLYLVTVTSSAKVLCRMNPLCVKSDSRVSSNNMDRVNAMEELIDQETKFCLMELGMNVCECPESQV